MNIQKYFLALIIYISLGLFNFSFSADFTALDGNILTGEITGGEINLQINSKNVKLDPKNIYFLGEGVLVLRNGGIQELQNTPQGFIIVKTSSGTLTIPLEKLTSFCASNDERYTEQSKTEMFLDKTLTTAISKCSQGNITEGLKQALDLRNRAEQAGLIEWKAYCDVSIAAIYLKQKKYQESIDLIKQTLPLLTILKKIRVISEKDASIIIGNACSIISTALYSLGKIDLAANYLESCIAEIRVNQSNQQSLIDTLLTVAGLYKMLGDYETAISRFTEVDALTKNTSNITSRISALDQLGQIYFFQGNISTALTFFKEEVSLRSLIGEKYEVISQKLKNGEIITGVFFHPDMLSKMINSPNDLIEIYNVFLSVSGFTQNVFEKAPILSARAHLYEKMNNLEKAADDYEKAIQEIESLRFSLNTEYRKVTFFEQYSQIYHDYQRLLIKQNKIRQAFIVSEKKKAKNLNEMLHEKKLTFHDVSPETLKQEKKLESQISYSYWQLAREQWIQQQSKVTDTGKITLLQNDLKNAENELTSFLNNIRKKYSNYSSLKNPEIITVDDIQKIILREKSAMISFSLGKDETIAYVITASDIYAIILPISENELMENIINFKSYFENIQSAMSSSKTLQYSHYLYSKLIEPCREYLDTIQKLIISPDSILNYIPWNALSSEPSEIYEKSKFLIHDYSITITPSATTLKLLRQKPSKKIKDHIVAIGDPIFAITKKNQDGTIQREEVMPRLINTKEEIEYISKIYSPDTQVYMQENAREEIMKSPTIENASIIHLSTHGSANPEYPFHSVLAFSQTDTKDSTEDGYLYAYEVFGIALNADLVMLSACQTNLGKLTKGEGILSLSRAFMYAGTSSVIATLWSVDDKASALLAKLFYTNLKNDENKDDALRNAQLTLMQITDSERKISYSSPYFWAGYTLIGNSD